MKQSNLLKSSLLATSLALHAQAYLEVEEGAFNVRHIHMVERGVDGEIVGRAFGNTYEVVKRDSNDLEARGDCTTILACGTPGGCAMMAGQRYCKGKSWEKSFQEAVSQTGANGVTGLKMMAEGIGRGPVGMVVNMAKSTAKAIIDAKKESEASKAAEAKRAEKQKGANRRGPAKKAAPKKGVSKSKKAAPRKAPSRKGTNGRGPKKAAPMKGVSKPKRVAPRKAPARKGANSRGPPKKTTPGKSSPQKKAAPRKSAPKAKSPAPKRGPTPRKAPAPKRAPAPKPKPAAPKGKTPAPKKTKRDLEGQDVIEIVNKRDFEVVERDQGMNFIRRSEYSIFGIVARDEDGSIVSRECETYNGDVSCM
ncbi:hypothetical protein FA13DRAFT_1733248 [Coprinellus micaceus]|uniref:Uncharacterized protein n=1 Tax=Coprinellus micaceus TaxID=71717 RepID=A0A4Y7T9I2_COPMI|nr:hypothetical protein FA13DRAFT_1733248 [Coprinellus micaceus]